MQKVFSLNSAIALKLYIWLLCLSSSLVHLTTADRIIVREQLGISNNQITNALKCLKDAGIISGTGGTFVLS